MADTIAPDQANQPIHQPRNRQRLTPTALRAAEREAYALHTVEMLPIRTIASRQGVGHPTVLGRIRKEAKRVAERDASTIASARSSQTRRYESLLADAIEDYHQDRTIARLKAALSVLARLDRLHALDRAEPAPVVYSAHTTIAPSTLADDARALLGRELPAQTATVQGCTVDGLLGRELPAQPAEPLTIAPAEPADQGN